MIKRIFDITLGYLLLILLLPVFLLISFLVLIFLGRPILFSQSRPGLNEKNFKMYKFRTMKNTKDSQGVLLSDDERLTKFGKFLRSSSLDELPELYNIIRGDMSFVGPRPLLEKYLPLYNGYQKQRHNVKPGITGLAQVNGRNSLSWEDKFNFDVYYVKNQSVFLDIKIIFKTILVVFLRTGVSSDSHVTMTEFKGSDK